MGQLQTVWHMSNGTLGREESQKGIGDIFETIITENFPQINVRHQTTDPGS